MKQISGKEFARLIQRHGWTLARVKGSHHIFIKLNHRERVVVPIHANTPLKLGLLKHLMRTAGITESDL